MRKFLAALVGSFVVSGCMTTTEMPLAPNVVRIDTRSEGLLFTSQTTSHTMTRAAELTLQAGYSHFRFEDASVRQGTVYGGSVGSGGFYRGNYYGFSAPLAAPANNVGVTVYMFHANEPEAQGAFDAASVLRQYGGGTTVQAAAAPEPTAQSTPPEASARAKPTVTAARSRPPRARAVEREQDGPSEPLPSLPYGGIN